MTKAFTTRRIAIGLLVLLLLSAAGAALYWRETTRWFRASELDRTATPTDFINPQFPEQNTPAGHLGRLRLDVYVDEQGAVERVVVVESTLPPVFAERATAALLRARFDPARRFGRAVRSVKTLQLDIEPPPPGEGTFRAPTVKR